MIQKFRLSPLFLTAGLLLLIKLSSAQRIMEKLDRGTVAITDSAGVFISWRLLATDPQNIAFNVYRNQTKINASPLKQATSILDKWGTVSGSYSIIPVIDGKIWKPSLRST